MKSLPGLICLCFPAGFFLWAPLNNPIAANFVDLIPLASLSSPGLQGGTGYDLKTAARAVIDEFGADRVAWVVASNVNYHDFDGRLSKTYKKWAKEYDAPKPDMYLQSHMTVIDGFVDNFRKVEDIENEVIKQVLSKIKEMIKIPCTACRYCEPLCPENIAIPEYLMLYNTLQYSLNKEMAIETGYYLQLLAARGKPIDCNECRICEETCPQRLDIPAYLQEVNDGFAENMRLWAGMESS